MTRLFPPLATEPRVFALPPGVDFLGALIAGLDARLGESPPEALAEVEIYLNTRRAARALTERLAAGPARLLPRIRTVADLAEDPLLAPPGLPPPIAPLRRRLELARLVRGLLAATGLAPPSAGFALAESLMRLLDEMGAAGIAPDRLRALDAGDHAAHWQTALRFLDIAARHAAETGASAGETRLRAAVETLARSWAETPPRHPVIIAGSTGSRPATRLLMAHVARLPQGAIVLPGLDPTAPARVWARLGSGEAGASDHPQHPFRALGDALGFDPAAVPAWAPAAPVAPERAALISLALRPAPVTDQWRAEAPAHVPHLARATAHLALIEAASPVAEAAAIALALREAAEAGRPAALVTPDRTLARQVTARLARWSIIPDDSAGRPLALTPPGVLLSLLAGIEPGRLGSTTLLALLKHPLAASRPGARAAHLRLVEALETGPLAGHPPLVAWPLLHGWAEKRGGAAPRWLAWAETCLAAPLPEGPAPLATFVAAHRRAAEALAAGPDAPAPQASALWEKAAGEGVRLVLEEIAASADAADPFSLADYQALFQTLLAGRDVPEEAVITHPGIAIWGTLEARVQWAERVILGGLNEGVWPRLPEPDPWLSRPMRRALGLAAPETRVGLAAHDFMQAAAAPEVILSRAVRDAEAPTVASRWLLRLENLMKGMGDAGEAALAAMRARGGRWLEAARALDAAPPLPPARRPAPIPPPAARPRRLSVTEVERLVRDPYAVYARHVLHLRPIEPPGREADALARGRALHAVMEAFVAATAEGLPADPARLFRAVVARTLAAEPWPAVRAIWAARLERVMPWLLATEVERRARALPFAREVRGTLALAAPAVTLTARADRIDRTPAGTYAIYDYKSGGVPSEKEAAAFHLQLPLEAAIAAGGGFEAVPPAPVTHMELIGLGKGEGRSLDPARVPETLERLAGLLAGYLDGAHGFTARLRPQRISYESPYDHLSRFGEWGDGDPAATELLVTGRAEGAQ